ncbi:hypothetical protein [Nitrosococcus oceani]|uniref:hypothetical protein n=1 Tax=Nitrosococcus oceani TaxID=1229 RepID=UPI0011979410|nr:hypothetical protein [Nitrosococcus oceani]GEM21639.1 hypothetical protein NONS58_30880 [Nitrosococcus oceani]
MKNVFVAAIISIRRVDIEERLNLQREGAKAKPYQVHQVRAVILKYRLGVDDDA